MYVFLFWLLDAYRNIDDSHLSLIPVSGIRTVVNEPPAYCASRDVEGMVSIFMGRNVEVILWVF